MALNDAVLLRGVWGREVAQDPLIGAIRHELSCCEFTIIVHAEHPKLAAALLLHGCLVALDGVHNCCLGIEQHGPHIAGGVVDE